MSGRIGMLSAVAVLLGGLCWWSASAQEFESGLEQPATYQPRTSKKTVPPPVEFPAPPVGRAEGIFDLSVNGKAEHKIHAALGDPNGVDIEFIDTPLRDAMDFLASAHKITIIIDEQALTEEGIAIDEPINRTLSGIKLNSALNIMLEPLKLAFFIEDEVLKITTRAVADKKRETRVYDTGYLKQIGIEPDTLSSTIQAVILREHAKQGVGKGSGGLAVAGNGGIFGSPSPRKASATAKESLNTIEVLGDMLVVSAPRSVHEDIRKFLIQVDRRWELQQPKK